MAGTVERRAVSDENTSCSLPEIVESAGALGGWIAQQVNRSHTAPQGVTVRRISLPPPNRKTNININIKSNGTLAHGVAGGSRGGHYILIRSGVSQ